MVSVRMDLAFSFRMFRCLVFLLLSVVLLPLCALGATYYVDAARPDDGGDGTSWATAKRTIQAAVDLTQDGDTVLVTNGVYDEGGAVAHGQSLMNRACITNAITLRSVNGPEVTVIEADGVCMRGVYLADGACLNGFTVTNGYTMSDWSTDAFGGGAMGENQNAVISNCCIAGNRAYGFGGGAKGCSLVNCVISNNRTQGGLSSSGGGVHDCTLYNCLLTSNTTVDGFGGGAGGCTLYNCTVTGNRSDFYAGGTLNCTQYNCIVWGNIAVRYPYNGKDCKDSESFYTCASDGIINGMNGCITDNPLFVDAPNGDFRLQVYSPCVNVGDNAYAPTNVSPYDLDGNPRIFGGTVDMGAYEVQCEVPQLVITTTNLPNGTEMVVYSVQLAATNGAPPLSWRAVVGCVEETQSNSFSAVGTAMGWHADDNCWSVPIPFDFPFYGINRRTLYINSNGTLTFDGAFSGYSANLSTLMQLVMIAPMWRDLSTYTPDDIFISSSPTEVTVRWGAHYLSGTEVNFSATLDANGLIHFKYGSGSATGGMIGISAGDGQNYLLSGKSQSGSMSHAADIVFIPAGELPNGLSVNTSGLIGGNPASHGQYLPTFEVTDSMGRRAITNLPLVITTNANQRPVIDSYTPTNAVFNMYANYTQVFAVVAHDPESLPLSYRWLLNGEPVGTDSSYELVTEWSNAYAIWTMQCYVEDDLWTNIVKNTWQITVSGDNDGDGMPNTYETNYPGVLNPWVADGTDDYDNDFADNLTEYQRGTCPTNRDSNGDGLSDGWQIRYGSDPLSSTGAIADLDLQLVGGYISGDARGVSVNGNYAYLATLYSGLQVVDVTNPTNPVYAGSCASPMFTRGVHVSGDYAYLSGDYSEFQMIDVSSPSNPLFAGSCSLPGFVRGVYARDNYAYVANSYYGLQVIDVSTPTNLVIVGSCETTGGGACGVYVSGNYAYVADNNYGLDVIDVSNPANPVLMGNYDTPGYPIGVYVSGNYAYVADQNSGLQVIDVSNPTNLLFAGSYDACSKSVYVSSNYAYMASANPGLQVIHVTDPANPISAGGSDTSYLASDVYVSGNYIYMAAFDSGLQIIENKGLADSDQDGMLDSWEIENFGDLSQGATDDYDVDGIWNIGEAHANLCPTNTDQDVDGLNDGLEVHTYNSTPEWTDSDWDGLSDSNEVSAVWGKVTRPDRWDTDGDGMGDRAEYDVLRDPTDPSDGGATATLSGRVHSGGLGLEDAEVRLRGVIMNGYYPGAWCDADGLFSIAGIEPGSYCIKVLADGYADEWYDGVNHRTNASTYRIDPGSVIGGMDFDLAPGQSPALAYVTSTPSNALIYLDFLPTGEVTPALIELGECLVASHGTPRHAVTVNYAGLPQLPQPCPKPVAGVEAETVTVDFQLETDETGSVSVRTAPPSEVFIDYADVPLGVTPLVVGNLAAGSHTLLLRVTNTVLRPLPVVLMISTSETVEVNMTLNTNLTEGANFSVQSVPPQAQVYLNYMEPVGVTPLQVSRLSVASHDGAGWYSASHTVLLRKEGYRKPYPRTLPMTGTGSVSVVLILAPEQATFNEGYDMPDQWIDAYDWNNLPPEEQDKRNADEDADGDGVSNADEMAAGTDPTNPDSMFDVRENNFSHDEGQGFVQLTFATVPGMKYIVQKSVSLGASWQNLSGVILATEEYTQYACRVADYEPTAFYRIIVIPSSARPTPPVDADFRIKAAR